MSENNDKNIPTVKYPEHVPRIKVPFDSWVVWQFELESGELESQVVHSSTVKDLLDEKFPKENVLVRHWFKIIF